MKRKWRYSLLLVACFAMSMLVFPVSAATDSGTYGNNLTWTFDSDTGTITFSGTGVLTAIPENSTDGYMKYCADIRHIVVAEGITEVAPSSFPWSVFWNVESIWIADSVEKIDRFAFANHFHLKQLRLGRNLKVIGEAAFMSCEELESLTLPAGLQSIGVEAFSLSGIKELVIPEGITVLEPGSFRGSRSLTRLVIPTSVTHIKNGAFRDCVSLKDVYYTGSQSQWEAINLEHSDEIAGDATTGSNTPLITATIHYNHTHSYTEEKVTVAASCAKAGEKLCICECGAAETRTIAKTSQHAWNSGKVTKAASCAKEGEKTYTCADCNTTKTESVPKISDHTWDAGTQNADTTVTNHCTLCDAVKKEGTPTTEPVPTESTTAESENKVTEEATTVPIEPADEEPAVGTDDATQEQPKEFPWVAVCIGTAVLLAAGGALIWLRVRKKA